jgi:hypothetical protein
MPSHCAFSSIRECNPGCYLFYYPSSIKLARRVTSYVILVPVAWRLDVMLCTHEFSTSPITGTNSRFSTRLATCYGRTCLQTPGNSHMRSPSESATLHRVGTCLNVIRSSLRWII